MGVAESKRHLPVSGLVQIRIEGSRGGAGLLAEAVNALLRRGWLLNGRGNCPFIDLFSLNMISLGLKLRQFQAVE